MATNFHGNESSRNDGGSERNSPLKALTTLLGVYTALYLAVVGAIHFATSPDAAAAVVPEVTSLHVTVTTLPVEPFAGAGGVPATRLLEPDADDTDNSRECTEGIDTACIY